jgi:hypothetical protein
VVDKHWFDSNTLLVSSAIAPALWFGHVGSFDESWRSNGTGYSRYDARSHSSCWAVVVRRIQKVYTAACVLVERAVTRVRTDKSSDIAAVETFRIAISSTFCSHISHVPRYSQIAQAHSTKLLAPLGKCVVRLKDSRLRLGQLSASSKQENGTKTRKEKNTTPYKKNKKIGPLACPSRLRLSHFVFRTSGSHVLRVSGTHIRLFAYRSISIAHLSTFFLEPHVYFTLCDHV